MSFIDTFQNIWVQVWGLWREEIQWPEPIGMMSPLDMTMFFAVAYMLADAVATISSRD